MKFSALIRVDDVFIGVPASPYILWQVGRAATVNIDTIPVSHEWLEIVWTKFDVQPRTSFYTILYAHYYFRLTSIWRRPSSRIFVKSHISGPFSTLSNVEIRLFKNRRRHLLSFCEKNGVGVRQKSANCFRRLKDVGQLNATAPLFGHPV